MDRLGLDGGRTLVVLPTYNEVDNLPIVVPGVLGQGEGYRVLVVDDHSPDGTGELADRLALIDPRVSVLHRPGKEGLGPAYIAGMLHGLSLGHDRIVTMDADLSHDPADLPRLVAAVVAGADVACGSRWVRGGGTSGWPLRRRLLSRSGSAYARTVLGLRIRDVTGGFKCFRRSAVGALDVATMRTTGYAFNIELNYRAVRRGLTVVEVPITFVERVRGRSKMGSTIILEALRAVPALRLAQGRVPEAVPVEEEGTIELTGVAQGAPVARRPAAPRADT
ncbi:MAG TPA: polyprenol monophosphomannose synthase [Candidatus Dormibacteraeota bacterium]|nr:polyprenol monophosphomannose synthase [Candidatus Dormibacteraeota bacterium]